MGNRHAWIVTILEVVWADFIRCLTFNDAIQLAKTCYHFHGVHLAVFASDGNIDFSLDASVHCKQIWPRLVSDGLLFGILSTVAPGGITSINCSGCQNITDEAIEDIAVNCPALTSLIVSSSRLTDEAIKAIATNCLALAKLDVSDCQGLTDESIKAIAENCPSLTELKVAALDIITDESFFAISAHCPSLTSLDISHMYYEPQLTDAALLAIAAKCPSLRVLHMEGCGELSIWHDDLPMAIWNLCPSVRIYDEINDRVGRTLASYLQDHQDDDDEEESDFDY